MKTKTTLLISTKKKRQRFDYCARPRGPLTRSRGTVGCRTWRIRIVIRTEKLAVSLFVLLHFPRIEGLPQLGKTLQGGPLAIQVVAAEVAINLVEVAKGRRLGSPVKPRDRAEEHGHERPVVPLQGWLLQWRYLVQIVVRKLHVQPMELTEHAIRGREDA